MPFEEQGEKLPRDEEKKLTRCSKSIERLHSGLSMKVKKMV